MREIDSSAGNNHQIMKKSRSSSKLRSLLAEILHQLLQGKLASLRRQMNSLSMEEYIRKSMNSCKEKRITGIYASWLATFGFFVCLISLMLSKPLLQPQGPHSLWLAIIGMFSFTMFLSAVSVMLADGARFTQMQIAVMLITFFSLLLV